LDITRGCFPNFQFRTMKKYMYFNMLRSTANIGAQRRTVFLQKKIIVIIQN
jgi:hypothetical protein